MKRLRMGTLKHRSTSCLIVALALVAGSALGAPKKGSGGAGKGSAAPAKGSAASGSDSGEIEMDDSGGAKGGGGGSAAGAKAGGGGSGDSGEIEMDEDTNKPPSDLAADLAASGSDTGPVKVGAVKKTPLSWADILVVVRKPFLKTGRTELAPFVGITMNDNIIRHQSIGGELSYYLTDVLAIGVEGQYFTHTFEEPFDLVARQARRLPTVNEYKWGAALDFHYVPVYGKFAVLDHKLVAWEVFFTAGIGAGESEVIPRDARFPGFTNFLIQPNVGASMRFFLAKWLTVSLGVRDYAFIDHFEPVDRSATMNTTASEASANADSSFINNIMFQVGISFWIPTSFEYTTFR